MMSSSTCVFFSLLLLISAFFLVHSSAEMYKNNTVSAPKQREFKIENNRFVLDGNPIIIRSGSIHYSRVHPSQWADRLKRMKAMGLNALQTYVPWNFHEIKEGTFDFTGVRDIEKFLSLANDIGLLVLLRPGPYVCGEWDFGGFPSFLINHNVTLRSNDSKYLALVEKWFSVLLPKVKPYLLENNSGGSVIMSQIENEFGSYGDVSKNPGDAAYLRALIQMQRKYLSPTIQLYTTDGGNEDFMIKGSFNTSEVLTVGDFGAGTGYITSFADARKFNPPGMQVDFCSEFYTGWLTHWGEKMANVSTSAVAQTADAIFSKNGSINYYMAFGGTNFGYWNGVNFPDFSPVITSYDYDSPIAESGLHGIGSDNVDKYLALKTVHSKYLNSGEVIENEPAPPVFASFGKVLMTDSMTLTGALPYLCPNGPSLTNVNSPVLMERMLNQQFGFILLKTTVDLSQPGNHTLSLVDIRDRAVITVDGQRVGVISRTDKTTTVSFSGQNKNSVLEVLIENEGHINFGYEISSNEKGILGASALDGNALSWTVYSLPLPELHVTYDGASSGSMGPAFYKGTFIVSGGELSQDTYVNTRGWTKGVVAVNGNLLGRYFESAGPQHALYCPAAFLKSGLNEVVVFETGDASQDGHVVFTGLPDFGEN